jgi:hypothetical protein
MARLSKPEVAPNQDGPGTEWRADLDNYAVSIVAVDADTDVTELLKGLPDGQCPTPTGLHRPGQHVVPLRGSVELWNRRAR